MAYVTNKKTHDTHHATRMADVTDTRTRRKHMKETNTHTTQHKHTHTRARRAEAEEEEAGDKFTTMMNDSTKVQSHSLLLPPQ